MAKRSFPLSKVYQLLEPGPVVMVTTADKGKANVMTMSWHMMIDSEPPILACVISDQNYTFHIIKKTKECVINIPTVELAPKVVKVGNASGSKVDKLEKFHLLLLMLVLLIWIPIAAQNTHAIRAAIDIGSGGPKLRVAEVDLAANKIVKTLHIHQYPVIFQESLSRSGNRQLSPEIMLQGLTAIEDAVALARSYGADRIAVIGTSVFRNAVNGEQFADSIQSKTGLKVHVLDQELEGKLAYQAALAKLDAKAEDLIVCDIGGGSTQFIGTAPDGSYLIDASNEGSGPFRDFIIESIQTQNLKQRRTPNPFSSEHASLAVAHASSLSTKIEQVFQDKIRQPATQIIGVGSVFGRGIASLMTGKTSFTVEDLTAIVNPLIGKTDADLGGGDFACIEVSNALLVLGFMKGLAIQQMSIVDVNNADGAMVYPPFWE